MGVYLDRRSGRYGIDIRVPPTRDGKRVRFLVGTRKEAQAVLDERLTALRQGRFPILRPSLAPAVFDDVAERFLAQHATQRRDLRTFEAQVRLLKRFFGGLTLQQITSGAIRRFMRERLDAGVTNGTVNRSRAYLSSVLSFAIDSGIWAGPNPCLKGALGRVKPMREAPPRETYLTPEVAYALLDACEPEMFRVLVLVAVTSAMRRGELLGLRWTEIRNGCAHLPGSRCKSGRGRVVPLTIAAQGALASLPRHPATDLVFHRDDGRPLTDLRPWWDPACAKIGLTGFRFHDLRHAAISFAASRGIDALRLMKVAGHAALATTQRYLAASPAHVEEARRFLGPPTDPRGNQVATPLLEPDADRDTMARSRMSGSDVGGLQIRWEPGEPGSGGFDSHTLPPVPPHPHNLREVP